MLIQNLSKFVLHAGQFANNPEKTMIYYQKKLGDPFYFHLNPKQGVWVSGTPAAAQEIFTAKTTMYAKPSPTDAIETLLGPGSMILLCGKHHLQERQCMAPAFHGENMRYYGETIRAIAMTQLNQCRPDKAHDLYATMKNITLNIIICTIFGIQEQNQLELVTKKTLRFLNGYSVSLMFLPILRNRFWLPWRRYVNARNEFDDVLLKQIEDCRQYPDKKRKDVLAKLVSIVFPDGTGFLNQNLLDECRTLLMAGHETSATALTWALYYSLTNPAIKERLLTEVCALKPDSPIEEIIKLPYLTAVCEEAMRIHPIVPIIVRTLNQPFEFRGKLIKPGQTVALSITLLHSNQTIWEQPEIFNPDRFIGKHYSSYEYAPFGGGARRCLGAAFALYEMKIVLATLLLQKRLTIMPVKTNTPRLHGLTMGPHKINFLVQ